MNKLFYYPKAKMNARITDMIIPGFPIQVEGYLYERITKRPNGKRTYRKLINKEQTERIVLLA
jgi:hypothetical protein